MGALRSCRTVKLKSYSNMWSSDHTMRVIIMQYVDLSLSMKLKSDSLFRVFAWGRRIETYEANSLHLAQRLIEGKRIWQTLILELIDLM